MMEAIERLGPSIRKISEATAIRCDDIRKNNGVYYIHVPKSKTTTSICNVPMGYVRDLPDLKPRRPSSGRLLDDLGPHFFAIIMS